MNVVAAVTKESLLQSYILKLVHITNHWAQCFDSVVLQREDLDSCKVNVIGKVAVLCWEPGTVRVYD